MKKRTKGKASAIEGRVGVPAGDFSQWLHVTEASLRAGNGGADVPCGTCRGCCRSSMFIHVKPEEKQTIQRIPQALLFPAPGLPKGHVLMGYDEKGQCPMFVDNQCSIYEDRPQTCRDYDCRIFAATGIAVDPESQPEIAERVAAWEFNYEREGSSEEQRLLREAATFLQENRDLFPQGSLPSYPVQLAAVAVRVYALLAELKAMNHADGSAATDALIARAIVTALGEGTAE
jgi:Fe-S-cluster containining protein